MSGQRAENKETFAFSFIVYRFSPRVIPSESEGSAEKAACADPSHRLRRLRDDSVFILVSLFSLIASRLTLTFPRLPSIKIARRISFLPVSDYLIDIFFQFLKTRWLDKKALRRKCVSINHRFLTGRCCKKYIRYALFTELLVGKHPLPQLESV